MKTLPVATELPAPCQTVKSGFTVIELLTVIAIISVLASILLPALSKSRDRAQAIICLNNNKQLVLAWHLYASDNEERLPYNLGMVGTSFRTDLNWVNNVMTWDLNSDNTNTATLTKASLGSFVSGNPGRDRNDCAGSTLPLFLAATGE